MTRFCLAVAIALSLSGVARAESSSGASLHAVDVTIESTEAPLEIDVLPPGARSRRSQPIVTCKTPCRLRMARGHYKLFVRSAPGIASGSRRVDIQHPVSITLEPRARWTRPVGLTLGIVSAVPLVLFAALAMVGGEPDTEDALLIAGLGVVGGVGSAVGWTMFGQSYHPGISYFPDNGASASISKVPSARFIGPNLHFAF